MLLFKVYVKYSNDRGDSQEGENDRKDQSTSIKTTMSGQLLHLHGTKKISAPGTEKYGEKNPYIKKKQQS